MVLELLLIGSGIGWLLLLIFVLLHLSTRSGGATTTGCPLGFVEIGGEIELLSGVNWRLLRLLYLK